MLYIDILIIYKHYLLTYWYSTNSRLSQFNLVKKNNFIGKKVRVYRSMCEFKITASQKHQPISVTIWRKWYIGVPPLVNLTLSIYSSISQTYKYLRCKANRSCEHNPRQGSADLLSLPPTRVFIKSLSLL